MKDLTLNRKELLKRLDKHAGAEGHTPWSMAVRYGVRQTLMYLQEQGYIQFKDQKPKILYEEIKETTISF